MRVVIAGNETYLADSMQFMLEYACRVFPGGAFYLMPSFRAEATDSSHLSEFYHSEIELPGTLDSAIAEAEAYVVALIKALLSQFSKTIEGMLGDAYHEIAAISESSEPFPRLTFEEASRLLGDDNSLIVKAPKGWRTLTRLGEVRLLYEIGHPVWITHWDADAVPFYQAVSDDGRLAMNADLLAGVGEMIGAGQRHATGEDLERALIRHDVERTPYRWYIDLKREWPLLTAGFGLGVERFLMWITGQRDIRDIQVVLREYGRLFSP